MVFESVVAEWLGSGDACELAPDLVRMWFYDLDQAAQRQATLASYLDDEERAQVERFRFDTHRQRFIARRGLVREILACYVDVDPASLVFARNEFGKPFIAQPETALPIRFNVSHSRHMGVIAIGLNHELGIDLEQIRPLKDSPLIVESQLPEEEQQAFLVIPEAQRLDYFYGLWTCKEAYLKAKGLGLNGDLKAFVVADVLQTPRLVSSLIDKGSIDTWWFHRPVVADGFSCCVALKKVHCRVVSNEWLV